MKMIILAAGKGERLLPITATIPKALMNMGKGKTLLEEQLYRMEKSGVIDEVVIIVGYLAHKIEEKVKGLKSSSLAIKTVYNPFFDVSNNLMSLWFARPEMTGDFMITNGDNIFTPDVFSGLAFENKDGIFLSTSQPDSYDVDDMKVTIKNGLVTRVSKDIAAGDCQAESPGLVLVRGDKAIAAMIDGLDTLARELKYRNCFWLELFNYLADAGTAVKPWEFDGNSRWQEIDFHWDIKKASDFLKLKI